MVTSEVSPQGMEKVIDTDQFRYSCGGQLFRIQANQFPLPPKSIAVSNMKNPILQTYEGGQYTSSLSGCVTPVQALSQGVYILVPSTFNPQEIGSFDLAVYSSTQIDC